jgi:lipopolysaccharide assembly outer membrane protein LptD (OstA)
MPLGLPFGFFPNTNKRTSGFLIPEFRDEQRRGFGLENGGWYFAFNDYLDFSIAGSLYSRGTWGLKTISQYLKKYKYSGQFSAQFFINRINDDPSATSSKDFKISWSHSQDPKANPTRTFHASVDFSTSSFEKKQGNSFANILENQKNSSIAFTKRWPGRPFNLSANMSGNQNTQSRKVNLTLPSVMFNMERIYPFRGKDNDGKYNWLENIQVSYSSKLENKISNLDDSLVFTKTALKNMRNGFSHSIPISLANIKVLKYINITPGVTYNGVLFPYYIRKTPIADTSVFRRNTFAVDTIHKVTYAHAFSASLSVSAAPKLYGTYINKRENAKIIAVRHVMTPRAALSFSPDMKKLVPDYYRDLPSSSSAIEQVSYNEYSVYEGQIYSTPTVNGKSGSMSFGLDNNVEAKVKSKNDSTGEGRKVVLLDNLNFSTSYRPFATVNRWAPVNMDARSSLFKNKLQIQVRSTFDPYALDSLGRLSNKFLYSETGKIFRVTNASLSVGFRLQSSAGKKKEDTPGAETQNPNETEEDYSDMYDEGGGAIRGDYVDFDIPWSLSFSYSWDYRKPLKTKNIQSSVRITGDISITPKWKIGLNTAYDFMAKEFSATNISIYRDLHCWEMQFALIPIGDYKSYSFTIRAKSAILRDLKWDKRRSWQDNL